MKVFHLPDLGEGLAEAEIREWYISVGDTVKVDQPLVSMETAKAVVDVPSPYAGKIVQLHGNPSQMIETGSALITFDTGEGQAAPDKGSVVGKLETSEKKWDDGAVIIGSAPRKTPAIKAMPAARALATEMKIDLSKVTSTGSQGLITVDDVKKAVAAAKKPSYWTGETEALHGVRRIMAQTMTHSHEEVVPVTIFEDVDLSHLPAKTDITVRLLKALAAAAQAEPSLNAWYDGHTMEREVFKEVHIGLAVDTAEGLFVPVIRDVANKSDQELRETIDAYKVSVKNRSVAAKDMQGATVTLSNFGMIAGRYATPIIVPPAVAILGCGRSRDTALVKDGQVVVGKVMPLSLTFDHRSVTGGEATRFLGTIIKSLEAAE